MATTTTVTSNYKGTTAGLIIGKAFKENNTLQHLTVYEDINYDLNLRRIQLTNGRRAHTCGFLPGGAITLDERVLKPKKFTTDFEGCMEDFRATWSDEKMGMSAQNAMPSDIENAIVANVLASEAQDLGYNIWQGDSSNPTQFDGFIKLFGASASGVINVTGTTITESNVDVELKKALAAIPVALKSKDVKVFVDPATFQAYTFFLISKGITALGDASNKSAMFGKYELISDGGLPANSIVIAEQSNLVFGTGLKSDHNNIYIDSTSPERILDGSYKGKLVYNAGVQFYFGNEIVYYHV
jgi:hypothetical protein